MRETSWRVASLNLGFWFLVSRVNGLRVTSNSDMALGGGLDEERRLAGSRIRYKQVLKDLRDRAYVLLFVSFLFPSFNCWPFLVFLF